ncbi:MAG: hypothetical protein HPY61_11115 [Methanotrichaceae archaeon]|nr:hypothetical protein [Methanotrichaceae archaeon]
MILSLIWMGNVAAIQISVSSDDSTVSTNYMLSDDAALRDGVSIFDGGTVVNRAARGTGSNSISTNVGGDDYSAGTAVYSSGQFSLSSSIIAAGNGALISQDTGCSGDAGAEIYGIANGGAAGQQAAVLNGRLSSLQNLAVGGGALASQDTAVDGESGSLGSSAISPNQLIDVSGSYSDEGGFIDAKLSSIGGLAVDMQGTANIVGVECLDDSILGTLKSNGYSMEMDGVYEAQGGDTATFNLEVSNIYRASAVSRTMTPSVTSLSLITSGGRHPEIVANPPGNPSSYVLEEGMIDSSNPLQLYLRTDSYLTAEGLSASASSNAISLAAGTWDYWTSASLFTSSVICDSTKDADTVDGYSVHAFRPVSGTALAYTRNYFDQGGYIVESDVVYNSNYAWTTDYNTARASRGKTKDLQTVALHELGHTCGLGDLYTLPSSDPRASDYYEIMNLYTGPRHYLGAGDIAGIQAKYGA